MSPLVLKARRRRKQALSCLERGAGNATSLAFDNRPVDYGEVAAAAVEISKVNPVFMSCRTQKPTEIHYS